MSVLSRILLLSHLVLSPALAAEDEVPETGAALEEYVVGDAVYLPKGELVYLTGQVERPCAVGMESDLTLLQAITRAGGPTPAAALRGAYIPRNGERLSVNPRRVINGRDPDVQLEPADQVVIRQSAF